MKIKTIVALTLLLITLIFISIFFGQQAVRIPTAPEKPAIETRQVSDKTQWQWPLAETPSPRRLITVIKMPGKEDKAALPILDRENKDSSSFFDKENKMAKKSSSQEAASISETEEDSSGSQAGITAIDNQPTDEEMKEMKTKGIVLY